METANNLTEEDDINLDIPLPEPPPLYGQPMSEETMYEDMGEIEDYQGPNIPDIDSVMRRR